jgi:hypothetical protein
MWSQTRSQGRSSLKGSMIQRRDNILEFEFDLRCKKVDKQGRIIFDTNTQEFTLFESPWDLTLELLLHDFGYERSVDIFTYPCEF